MSYFDNVNRTVTRKVHGSSFGKEITRKDLIPVKDRGNRKALTESSTYELKDDLEKKVQKTKLNQYTDSKTRREFLNDGYKNLKDDLIKDIMREICVESLVVDEEPVMDNLNNIFDLVDEQVDNIGGFESVKATGIRLNNAVLNEMVHICESMAKEVADRVLKEDLDSFKMNDTEVEKFDYDKKQMGVDRIVDVVKNKVFKVVKDEQKTSEEKEEIMTEIKSKLEDIDAPVEEAMDFIFGQDKVEEVSLFSSMMRKNYKNLLETSSASIYESSCCKNVIEEDDDEIDINDIDVQTDEKCGRALKVSDVSVDDKGEKDINELINHAEDDAEVEEIMLKENKLLDKINAFDEKITSQVYKKGIKNIEQGQNVLLRLRVEHNALKDLVERKEKGLDCKDVDYSVKHLVKFPKSYLKKQIKNLETCERLVTQRIEELKSEEKAIKESAIVDIKNKFIEIGEEILEASYTNDVDRYSVLLNELAEVTEACVAKNKTVKKAKACKEFTRDIETSTEKIRDEVKEKKGKDGIEVVMEIDEDKQSNIKEKTDNNKAPREITAESFCRGLKEKINNYFEKSMSKKIAKRDFTQVRNDLTTFVKNAATVDELEYLSNDLNAGITQLEKAIIHYPDASSKIKEHIKWLKTDYVEMIEKRKKEIKVDKVTESFSARLDVVCDKLDEIIEKHEDALYEAKMSMETEYEGKTIILPMIESIDYNLSNIKFVYKIKTVCETLNSMVYNIENEIDAVQLQEMIQLNLASITSTKAMLESNEDVSEYKLGLLETAKIQLSEMDENIDRIRNDMEDRMEYQVINEAKDLVDELYDSKRNTTLIEQTQNERMELVMAEAITKYTILETFNTLNLLQFDKETVRQMARNNIR